MFLKLKKENGAITLFVLVSMLFFIIVLMGIYVNISNKIQKQEKEIQQIQKSYQKEDINSLYQDTIKITK